MKKEMEAKALIVVERMFNDRGYKSLKRKVVNKDEEYNVLQGKDANNRRVCYFIEVCEKLTNDKIRLYRALLDELDAKHCVIAYNEKTSPVEECLKNLELSDSVQMEIFQIKRLQFVVIDHVLQPLKFTVVSKKDLGRISSSHLPTMLKTDPIARYYNYDSGQIIEVLRRDNSIVHLVVR